MALDGLGAFGFARRAPTALRCGGVALALLGAMLTRKDGRGGASRPLLTEMRDGAMSQSVQLELAPASVTASAFEVEETCACTSRVTKAWSNTSPAELDGRTPPGTVNSASALPLPSSTPNEPLSGNWFTLFKVNVV